MNCSNRLVKKRGKWPKLVLCNVLLGITYIGCQRTPPTESPPAGAKNESRAEVMFGDQPDLTPVSSNSQTASPWPRFLGSQIDGVARLPPDSQEIRTDWSDDQLPLQWQTDVGEGYAIGVVADGRYFHFDKFEDSARMRCLNASTGKQIWEYKYPSSYKDLYGYDSGPRSSPLVDGNRVYLYGVEGKLLCLSTDDGKPVWTVDTVDRFGVFQNFFGVASNPVVHDDLLLVMVGGSPPDDARIPAGQLDRVTPNGSCIVAFDKMTGEVKYKTGNDLASYSSLTWMEAGGKKTLLAWARAAVLGIDPETGDVKFTFPWRSKKLESVNAMTPVVAGNRFLVSECYERGSAWVEVVDNQCEILWSGLNKRKKSLQAHWCTPVVHNGFLYGCSGRHSGSADLRCIELETGKIQWVQRGFRRCSVLLVGERLVVLGEAGRLALVNATPKGFELITERLPDTTFALTPDCWAAPIIADGKLFVRGGKKVGCFDLVK